MREMVFTTDEGKLTQVLLSFKKLLAVNLPTAHCRDCVGAGLASGIHLHQLNVGLAAAYLAELPEVKNFHEFVSQK